MASTLTANLLRNYPLVSSPLDTSLIQDIRVLVPPALGIKALYLQRFQVTETKVSTLVVGTLGDGTDVPLLTLNANKPSQDLQVCYMTPIHRQAQGTIVLGASNALLGVQNIPLGKVDGAILPSCLWSVQTPGVTSIGTPNQRLTDSVTLSGVSPVGISEDGHFIRLLCTKNLSAFADKHSSFGNCPTPPIYSINGSTPVSNASFPSYIGDMYVLGVSPLLFDEMTTSPGEIRLEASGVSPTAFCSNSVNITLPPAQADVQWGGNTSPTEPRGSNVSGTPWFYYSEYTGTPPVEVGLPEFSTWSGRKQSSQTTQFTFNRGQQVSISPSLASSRQVVGLILTPMSPQSLSFTQIRVYTASGEYSWSVPSGGSNPLSTSPSARLTLVIPSDRSIPVQPTNDPITIELTPASESEQPVNGTTFNLTYILA